MTIMTETTLQNNLRGSIDPVAKNSKMRVNRQIASALIALKVTMIEASFQMTATEPEAEARKTRAARILRFSSQV